MAQNFFRSTLKNLFNKHLFATNTLTCAGLLGLGDAITQKLEHKYDERKQNGIKVIDWKRTGRMFTVGLMIGPVGHFWYKILDKYITGARTAAVVKKILADQILAAPVFCSIFFVGMGVLEGRGMKGGIDEVSDKFLTVYIMDWIFWPPAQFLNFYFLPPQVRMVYVSFFTLIWDCVLSYMKHQDAVFVGFTKVPKDHNLK